MIQPNTRQYGMFFASLTVLCVCMLPGCNRGPRMYQVSGKVLYKDGTVPHAPVCLVRFTPTGESSATIRKSAEGKISPDGTFTLSTRMPGDGVYEGEYHVAFTLCNNPMNCVSLLPDKYSSPLLSPYKVMVDGKKSDLQYEIELLPGAVVGGAPTAKPTSG